MSDTKVCKKCHQEKPISEFYAERNGNKDGLRGACKICINSMGKYYNKTHKEQLAEIAKKYVENNREKCLKYHKNYYATHKDRFSVYEKFHYEKPEVKIRMQAYGRLYSVGLHKKQVPLELFEAIKIHVALCRAIKQKKEALNV